MKNKKKKLLLSFYALAVIFLLVFLAGLRGLSLRNEKLEGKASAANDRLIGVFITTEYLDLFDMEGYLSDNLSRIMNSSNITLDASESSAYQGRIYATKISDGPDADWSFPDLSGIRFFSVSDSATETPTSYMISDPGISDAYTHYTETDTEHGVDLEATVYLMPASASVFYINPVYQDGDGAVYVTSGNGVSMGDSWVEGAAFSTKLEATSESSNSIQERTSISIRLKTCNLPDSFTILQMSEQNTPIAEASYAPDALPDSFAFSAETAYVLLEAHTSSPDGTSASTRQLLQRTEDTLCFKVPLKNGLCESRYAAVTWED